MMESTQGMPFELNSTRLDATNSSLTIARWTTPFDSPVLAHRLLLAVLIEPTGVGAF